MARTRGILHDNTSGRLYANVTTTLGSTADMLIAGKRQSTLSLTLKSPGTAISAVTATQGSPFNTTGIFKNISYKWLNAAGVSANTAAPQGSSANVALRRVSSTGVSSSTTYELPALAANGVISSTTIAINAGDTFYWDVINVGKASPGQGLIILADYFIG